MYKIYLN